MSIKQTRINVNINRQTEHALRGYAAMHQVSVTEALRVHVGIAAVATIVAYVLARWGR